MKIKFLFTFILFASGLLMQAQDFSLYQKKWFGIDKDKLPYRILMPLDFDSTKIYPVIFMLHGSGERGSDNELQLVHGAKLFLNNEIRKNYPAIVVFPQCPINDSWINSRDKNDRSGKGKIVFFDAAPATKAMQHLQKFVQFILQEYPAKKDQVYVGGLSMGGMGTFDLVSRMPKTFAAAFPICGGANPAIAKKINNTKWWIFHGAKDDVVLPQYSSIMANALKAAKASVKFTLYPDANNNSWDAAFAELELLPWLFAQIKK